MKKAIFLFALILGISGTSAAQSCGNGNYGNNVNYHNSIDAIGKVNIRKRGFVNRRWVVEANIIKDRGDKISLEYIFANGDVLTVMAKKQRQGGGHHGNGGFDQGDYNEPDAHGVSNNYYYGSSYGHRGNRGGQFEVHCVRMNGRTIANNCGSLRIEKGYGKFMQTFINIDMGRRGTWKGNAEVAKRGRY